MKKWIVIVILLALSPALMAQDEEGREPEKEGGFKKENLFTGGSLTLSFFSGGSIIGGTPIFGYKIAEWVDAGLAFNYIYTGRRDYFEFDDKLRQTVYGPGVFARLYPVKFLFVQGQLEHNFTRMKYIPSNGPSETFRESASSFLVGAGYAQGRESGSNTFYFISILFDVLKDEYSPYTEVKYDPNTGEQRVRAMPILRAGFNIGLFQGRYR